MTEREIVDVVTNVLAVAVLIEGVFAIAATIYITRIYVGGTRQSRIFRMLVRADWIKVVAGAWIGFLAVVRLANFPSNVLPPWTTPISAIVVMMLLWPPILHAWTMRQLRSGRGDGTPPPWHPDD